MLLKKDTWQHQREHVVDNDTAELDKTVQFGFKRIPEAEKVDRVLKHFNTVARKYDFMNTLLSFGIHYFWKWTAIRMMTLKPGDRVIDVCGGTGDLSILAARAVGPFGRVITYDINLMMMRAGKPKRNRFSMEKRISYVQGNAESISFLDNSFDAAMVGFGIRNLTYPARGFEEMFRVLKPGGKIMCLEFSKPTAPVFRWLYDAYSFYLMPLLGELIVGSRDAYLLLPESIRRFSLPDELTRLLEKIGFATVRYRRLTNGIAVVHLAEKPKEATI